MLALHFLPQTNVLLAQLVHLRQLSVQLFDLLVASTFLLSERRQLQLALLQLLLRSFQLLHLIVYCLELLFVLRLIGRFYLIKVLLLLLLGRSQRIGTLLVQFVYLLCQFLNLIVAKLQLCLQSNFVLLVRVVLV